ncbi:hypothetical protein ACE6H2_009550 [Prunus campanulata]
MHETKHLTLDFADPTLDEYDLETCWDCLDLPMDFYEHKYLESLTLAACKVEPYDLGRFGVLKDLSLVLIDFPVSALLGMQVHGEPNSKAMRTSDNSLRTPNLPRSYGSTLQAARVKDSRYLCS